MARLLSRATTAPGSVTVPDEVDSHGQPRRLPYDDAFYVVRYLHLKMEPPVFAESARLWLKILREQHPDEYKALLHELAKEEGQLA
ncbi:hypothetical protein [Streptomyces phaeoluteigriseus]